MTIYKILKDENEVIVSAEPLSLGNHVLEHGGSRLPIRIGEDDTVRVDLGNYEGDPGDLYLAGVEGDNAEETIIKRGEIRAMEVKSPEGEASVGLLGVNNNLEMSLVLKSLSEAPVVHGERGR